LILLISVSRFSTKNTKRQKTQNLSPYLLELEARWRGKLTSDWPGVFVWMNCVPWVFCSPGFEIDKNGDEGETKGIRCCSEKLSFDH